MGTYLNPSEENFREFAETGRYVDKTMLLDALNTRNFADPEFKFVCVSRPRRFGKSLAVDMIAAYYSKGAKSSDLFAKYAISKTKDFKKNLNKYNLIRIDLNAFLSKWNSISERDKKDFSLIDFITEKVCSEFFEQFPQIKFDKIKSIADYIQNVYKQTKEKFVIIIDEYDVLVRENAEKEVFNSYLSFLNSIFKNGELKSAIALSYITGILPIMKDKVQSKLNTFHEYTMLDASYFAQFVGFTTEEVKELCEKYDCSFEECKSWYDGYSLDEFEIYNPKAVSNALLSKKFKSYWSATSSYTVVSDKIKLNFDGIKDDVIKMLSGSKIKVNVETFENKADSFESKDDVFTYLIHLGYLAYSEKEKACYIPNREILKEWQQAIKNNADFSETDKIISDSALLLQDTIEGNEERVASFLDKSHYHVTSNLSYNNEQSLQSAIYLAYIAAINDYIVIKELPAGNGFADIVYIPFDKKKAAIIVELKRNSSAETALKQIKEKKYFACLDNWKGKIVFAGVNYDEKTKKHSCKIECFEKD